jgi:hypothetical protein
MNRHEQRKARVFEQKRVSVSKEQLMFMGRMCVWEGCAERISGDLR